jgi:tetratricopeptide (TPR) repeat protein
LICSALVFGACKSSEEAPTEISPNQQNQELELARAALESGDIRTAISRAFALSEAHPKFIEARVLLASAYVLDGKSIEALIEANKVVESDPKIVGGWVAKCAALRAQRRHDEAIEACEQALSLEPKHGAALKNLAGLYGTKKKWDKEGEMLERLKSVQPDDSKVRIAVASNRAARGETSEAIKEAKAGLERDPKNVNLLFFIAQASWEDDEIDDAIEYAELAAKFAPDRTEIVELFQRAFTVKVASALTCAHGPGPWTRDQKKVVLAETPIRGVQGVISFQRFYKDFKGERDFKRRLKQAVLRCQPAKVQEVPVKAAPPTANPAAAPAAPARPPAAPAQAP